MSKHLKRCAALVLSMAMAIQFCIGNSFFVYADEDPVVNEPAAQDVDTSSNGMAPEENETDATEETEPQSDAIPSEDNQDPEKQSAVLVVEYVTEEGDLLDTHEFSGVYVDDVVKAIDIEKLFEGYTLVNVEDLDNEYIIGQDLVLTKPEKTIRLIYKENEQNAPSETEEEEKPQITPNSVIDEEDENKTEYFEVRFYDENSNLIPVTTSGEFVQYVKGGETTTPPHQPVVKDGKNFVGWFTQPEGQGDKVDSFIIDHDIDFYAYYEAQTTFTITINYVFENTGNEAAKPYIAQVTNGSSFHAIVTSPVLNGYTADQDMVEISLDAVTEDKTYTVSYTGEPQTYTVKHMLQNVDLSGYTEDTESTETKTGYIGNYTDASAKKFEGFSAQGVNNILITENTTQDNVTIEIRYNRNSYNLAYQTGSGATYIPAQGVYFGEKLNDVIGDKVPTRLGYTFQGWQLNGQPITDDTTMPAQDVVVSASWRENTRASYTIVYWLENLDDGYDYVTSSTGTGNVGAEITANNLSVREWNNANIDSAGVERDTSKEETVTITSDGKAVKNVYYNRKTFHVYFYVYQSSGWFDGSWEVDDSLTITAKYGAYIADQWNDREHAAYEWNTEPNGSTSYTLLANMGAENITVYRSNRGTGTTIIYYIENLNGQREVYQTLTAADGVSLTEEDQTPIDGFTFDDWKDTTGWFDNTLWLYYTRNDYTISFENCSGVRDETLKFEETLSNARPDDSSVQPPAGVDSDYVFAGWYTSPATEEGTEVDWNSEMPSHNLQLYAKWEAPTYTVKFDTNGAGDIEPIEVTKYESIEDQMPKDPVKEGDTFLGWYTDENFRFEFIPSTNIVEDLTLHAKWESQTKGDYTIEYVDEAGREIHEPTLGTADLNTYVTVVPVPVEGYTATSGSSSQLLDVDGKIFRVVYSKDATWSFTVRYVDNETLEDILDPSRQEIPASTQQVIVQSPNTNDEPALADYMIVSDPQIVVNKDSVTGQDYVVTFYYTKKLQTYTVNHNLQMPDGSYQLIESDTLDGTIGYYVTAKPNNYEGYTCVSTQYQRSGVVTSHAQGEAGLVINVNYDRENPVTIQNYEGYYDGQAHGLIVNGTLIDTNLVKEEIQYSSDGSQWSSDPVVKTNVNDNGLAYVVYTRVNTTINGETHEGASETHLINIKKRPVTIKAPDAEKTYDGTPLNTWSGTAQYKEPEILQNETSLGFVGNEGFVTYYYTSDSTITAPGTQANKINQNFVLVDANLKSGTLMKNYVISFTDGLLTINDRPDGERFKVTITPNGATYTYDGTSQSVSGIKSSTFTTNDNQPLSGYTVQGVSFGANGTDANTYEVQQTGTVQILDSQGNDVTKQFEVNVQPAQLVIEKRPVTITADSMTWDYDGDPHSAPTSKVTAGSLANGHTYTAVVKANTPDGTIQKQGETADNEISDVHIFDANQNEVTTNYTVETERGTLRINAIDAEIIANVVIAEKPSTYNGKMQDFSTLSGDDYTLNFTFKDQNDTIDTTGWHLVNDEISVQRLTAGSSNVAFANPSGVKVVDKHGNDVKSAELNVIQGKLIIEKAQVTITAGSDEKEYDGTPLISQKHNETLQANDTVSNIQIVGSQLAPGSSDNVITNGSVIITNPDFKNMDVTDSYVITLEKGTLTVTNEEKENRVITITAGSAEKTYDGTPLTEDSFIVQGSFENGDAVNRDDVETYGNITVCGTEKNKIVSNSVHIYNGSTDVTAAYTIKYVDGELKVNQRPITLTADDGKKVYDGDPLTAPGVALTGTLGTGDRFETQPFATGSVINVTAGTENPVSETVKIITAGGEDRTDCYNITYESGILVITKAPASENAVSINSDTVTYDGNSHKLENATSLVTDGTTIYYRLSGQGEDAWTTTMPEFTDASRNVIEVKAVNPNFEDSTTSGTLLINRRPVTITGNSDTYIYNGQEQTVDGYTWTTQSGDTGLVTSHQISNVTASASATNVGQNIPGTITPGNQVQITSNGKNVTRNYLITTTLGTITITPKEITITSVSEEQKYNGQALIDQNVETQPELADGDSISYNFTGSQTNIGVSQNTFTANIFDENNVLINQNYKINYQYGELNVYGEISYDANEGEGEAPAPDRYDEGDTYIVRDNMFTREGYSFGGWNSRKDGTGRSFGEGAVITSLTDNRTLYAQWIADKDTTYTVAIYLEQEDGTYPEDPSSSIQKTAETDTTVQVTEQDLTPPEGYAFDPEQDNVLEGNVSGDGSLVLKIYFGKDVIGEDPGDGGDEIPDRYQLLFTYVAKENGQVTGKAYELVTFKTDAGYTLPKATTPTADVTAVADPGYHIASWVDEGNTDLGNKDKPEFNGKTYTENQEFTVSFEENEDITINYEAENGGSVDNESDTIAPATGNPDGSTAVPNAGYHFVEWTLNGVQVGTEEKFVPSRNDDGIYEAATYIAKFAPDEDTKYVVERYFSDDEGNYSDTADETIPYTGTTDTKVSISEKDRTAPEGYTFDPQADNVLDGTIAGDGSLVLKIYFGKDVIGEDPDEDGGDEIPDHYQILFTYVAKENGQVTGKTYELHTFVDENGDYYKPEPVTPTADVEAVADPGYEIDQWLDQNSNDLGHAGSPEFGSMMYAEDHVFTVSFSELEDITISYEAQEGGSVDNDKDVINPETGIPVGSTAKADTGYRFIGWYLNDTKVSDELTFVPSKNENGRYESATYTARFEKIAVPGQEEDDNEKSESSDGTDTATDMKMSLYALLMTSAGLCGLILFLKRKKDQLSK